MKDLPAPAVSESEEDLQPESKTGRPSKKRKHEKDADEVKTKKNKKSGQLPLNLHKIASRYSVDNPYLRDNWGRSDGPWYLILAPTRDLKTVYGRFDFQSFDGYLRSTSIDKANRTITFNWRGRDTGEGESTFSESNVMRITFLDDHTFEGTVDGEWFGQSDMTEKFDAEGSRNKVFVKNVPTWKNQV
jgi:hypothetical protein